MTTKPDRNIGTVHVYQAIHQDPRFRQLFPSKLAAVMQRSAECCRYETRRRADQSRRLAELGGDVDALMEADAKSGIEQKWSREAPQNWYASRMDEACWVRTALHIDLGNRLMDSPQWMREPPANGLGRPEYLTFMAEVEVLRQEIATVDEDGLLADALRVREDIATIEPSLQSPSFVHGDDFTWVIWNDTRYAFTKGIQAEAVRALWGSWEKSGKRNGCGLSEKSIGSTARSNADGFRLAHVFRNHPAWATMIRPVEGNKGVFALFR